MEMKMIETLLKNYCLKEKINKKRKAINVKETTR